MTDRSPPAQQNRQEALLRLVRERGRATVDELAAALGASRETIRRDLTAIAASGALRKFHGGAMAPMPEVEGSFRSRMAQAASAKRRIAHRAAALFEPGDSLFIDTGSTTLYFAEALQRASRLTIVTNSAAIAQAMSRPGLDHSVVLLGGEYAHDNQQTLGTMAVAQVRQFHLRHAVLTVGAIGDGGAVMDYSFGEAQVARAMIEQAASVTLLADTSKLGLRAPYEVCRLDRVARLVLDAPPPTAMAGAIARAGCACIVADGS